MEFREKYCRIDGSDDDTEDFNEAGDDEVNDSDVSFIDDEANFQDQEPTNHRLINVTRELQEAINDDSMAQELDLTSDDPKNFVFNFVGEIEVEYDEFQGVEKRIQKFVQELKIFRQGLKDSFYEAILFAVYYYFIDKKEDFDFCQEEKILTNVLGVDLFGDLKSKKQILQLDLSICTFETQCHVINDLLMERKLFLRVYELRKKFRYMIRKIPNGKNISQRDLSACVEERFNGFHLVRKLAENEMRQNFKLIDIVYKPVRKVNQIMGCYFSFLMRNAYRVTSEKKGQNVSTPDQCFACNKFFIERKYLQRHMNVCGSMPEILYKFENQNIQTLFDNMTFMGDVLFSIYFDFETTPGKKVYNFEEDASLYSVSYTYVVVFHPSLNIENLSAVRSFNDT